MLIQQYLVIGASSRIGKDLAGFLVRSGHKVFGTYFRHEMTSGEVSSRSSWISGQVLHVDDGISTLKV